MAGQPLVQVVSYKVGRPPHQGETFRGTLNDPRQLLLEAATNTGRRCKRNQMPPVQSEESVGSVNDTLLPCSLRARLLCAHE
eukprot:1306138-Amphidinium_carterae.2